MTHNNATNHHSQWHSPEPYLFGGISAMLTLIAFALIVLACSYWKSQGSNGTSVEPVKNIMSSRDEEEKVVVIMAGHQNPTFLAKPANGDLSR
eukprot:Gb_08829 [translate_table: standard]